MFPSHLSTRAPEHLTLRTRTPRYPDRYEWLAPAAKTRRPSGRRHRRG